jgi:amino acid transporter
VLSLGFVLVWGLLRSLGGHLQAVVPPPPLPVQALTVWLILRAFAGGCTAITGIEAVSNGVSAFRDPPTPRARATLISLIAILSCMLLAIGFLSRAFSLTAMDQTKPGYQTVLSQLTGAVYGHGWFYYIVLFSVLWVLCLSANTRFVDFPRLCHLLAHDGFLPRAFSVPGRRLVYSVGIAFSLPLREGC